MRTFPVVLVIFNLALNQAADREARIVEGLVRE